MTKLAFQLRCIFFILCNLSLALLAAFLKLEETTEDAQLNEYGRYVPVQEKEEKILLSRLHMQHS